MNMDIKSRNVGDIVADNFGYATLFKRYNIDFCCHGATPLAEACRNAGVDVDEITAALDCECEVPSNYHTTPFASWPIDLLIDYVLKIHHRGIRANGPGILADIQKVRSVHGEAHPELAELEELFAMSLDDLENHLSKEEQVLFPYVYALYEASERGEMHEKMHCGTVMNPIRVMWREHEDEGARYMRIREITRNFQPPSDACATYRLMLIRLEKFMDALFEHIHLENNIIFPRCISLEGCCVR